MKQIVAATLLLLAGTCTQSTAQENAAFKQFLRTKDSLMHIAFYEHDLPAYKKNLNELKPVYDKLSAKDKAKYKRDIEEEYCYLARAYALAGDKNNALKNLQLSNNLSYKELQEETDFDNIRKDPGFVKLLTTAKNKKSRYQELLQKDARYNEAEKNTLPAFSYQSANDPNLVALKNGFNLDSIAGSGSDVSQIINLMEWVHYLIPHDGSKGNPQVKNAMGFISECKRDKKTLNCRGLAILLNEVYLAKGFSSRFVTCLPKDTTDNDCHVITMVWAPSLKKWLWMDPTFMAYIMDEDGNLLSIEEVRNRLVNNKPLLLNPDANRNHGVTQTKDNYLGYYMSKNLYKLECPVSSEYNYETRAEGKTRAYVQLLPGTTPPKPAIVHDGHGVDLYTTYFTNNPKSFWAAPVGTNKTGETTQNSKGYSQSDYESIMSHLKVCCNEQQPNCIAAIVQDPAFWNEKTMARLKERYGKMIAFKYLGLELDNKYEDIALFRVLFEKSEHCMAISLNKEHKISTFRFQTYSNYIDWAMAKSFGKDKSIAP
ncbi:MAG: transglutaminase protein [Flavipsychrobacter sp.]|nr:transglutaminase protein [Flavipsychrobacter sp.]